MLKPAGCDHQFPHWLHSHSAITNPNMNWERLRAHLIGRTNGPDFSLSRPTQRARFNAVGNCFIALRQIAVRLGAERYRLAITSAAAYAARECQKRPIEIDAVGLGPLNGLEVSGPTTPRAV
jgi:hypothetical protein